MIGVNVDNLDTLVKKNDFFVQSLSTTNNDLVKTLNELGSCYEGDSLYYLFSKVTNQVSNAKSIIGIVDNYSSVLSSIKYSYQQQDLNMKLQIDNINSKLGR